ncbi:hypothetical protein LR68_01559 [Anoxybacillus sp. BCO1]|nr:hypothetical protein LR68_01559 [Anoxybacillus sp. BCO1]
MKNKQINIVIRLISFLFIAMFIWMTVQHFNAQLLFDLMHTLVSQPWHASYMFIMYGLAFVLRAMAWKWYLPQARFQTCIDGLFASLFINHIFPIKIGDAARIGICARRDRISFAIVAESVIVLRLLDLLCFIFLLLFWCSRLYAHRYSFRRYFSPRFRRYRYVVFRPSTHRLVMATKT